MDTQAQPVVEVRGLECRYRDTVVLANLNFVIYPGELFFIVGPSGSGKSTLLAHMIGLRQPSRGSVFYYGTDFTHARGNQRRTLLQRLGILFQNDALWSSMTLAENVGLPLDHYSHLPRSERHDVIWLKLAQVGLSGQELRYPSELGVAMRKRAALARAMALDPPLLFCDEPTTGLDPVLAQRIDSLLVRLRNGLGTTMIILSHDLSSIMRVADRIIFLDPEAKGIIAQGTPRQLSQSNGHPRVQEFFEPWKSNSGSP